MLNYKFSDTVKLIISRMETLGYFYYLVKDVPDISHCVTTNGLLFDVSDDKKIICLLCTIYGRDIDNCVSGYHNIIVDDYNFDSTTEVIPNILNGTKLSRTYLAFYNDKILYAKEKIKFSIN